jgi:hypothetical protein
MLSVIILKVIMLSVTRLDVVMLSVIMLNTVMLSVIMLNVVMLMVMGPSNYHPPSMILSCLHQAWIIMDYPLPRLSS